MSILHVSKSRVQLQEDGCICRYDIQDVLHALYTGCFACIRISSIVGRRVCVQYLYRTESSTVTLV